MSYHEMRLKNVWFNYLLSGEKKYEGRLNDDKRKSIKQGDFIKFVNVSTGECLIKKVESVYVFDSFRTAVMFLNYNEIMPGLGSSSECIDQYLSIAEYFCNEHLGVKFFKLI